MRIGLIGCGEIARRGHLPALKALRDFKVEAVADQDIERAQRVAREFGVAKAYGDSRELIEDTAVEAVVATVPPPVYKEIVSIAVANRKPLLVEKPLALCLDDAYAIEQKLRDSGVKVGLVQNYRYFPAVREIKRRVQSCSMGQPLSLHILLHIHNPLSWSLSPWKFAGPEGVLGDVGPHALDTLLWLADSDPKRVFAFGSNVLPGARFLNEVFLLVEFNNELVGFVDLSFLTGQMAFNVSVLGSGGRLFSDILFNQIREEHGRTLPTTDVALLFKKFLFILKGTINGDLFVGPLKFYQYLYPDFVRYVNGDAVSFPDVAMGVKTVKVMDAVIRSLATGAAVNL